MVYRPTVRYDDIFKQYVDLLFHATDLDRSQIIRAALFTAPNSPEFQKIMTAYKKKDVPLPKSLWHPSEHGYWAEMSPNAEKWRDVMQEDKQVIKFSETGGVKIVLS